MFNPRLLLLWITLVVIGAGCAVDERDARKDFLHSAFIDDHHDLLLRDAQEVEGKWARMAKDPFQFLRGDIGIWARDVVTPGFFPSSVGDGPTSAVLLVGDPHPENLGTFVRENGRVVVDWNDFDASRYGPFAVDLRRLALAFAVVRVGDEATDVARAVAEGYVAGADATTPLLLEEGGDVGEVFQALMAKARKKGEGEHAVAGLAALAAVDEVEGVVADDVAVRVDDDDRSRLLEALAQWRRSVDAPAVVDVVRIVGQGVGSRPLLRYHALLDDGRVAEAKEARDPFVLEGLALANPRTFVDNAERVTFARRALQSIDDSDALLGTAPLPPLGLRVQKETEWQRSLRVADLGAFDNDDVNAAARLAGRLLFHAHARAPGPSGEDRGEALRSVVHAGGAALVDETVAFVVAWKPVHALDHLLFRELLEENGPLLGWSP